MKYYITHILDREERKKYENMGLFCYDLRDSDFDNDIASIEKTVIVNRIGSMVTNKEIKLGDKYLNDFIDYDEFTLNNKEVNSIEELLQKNKNKDREVR